jgi:hypothetical protein
MKFTDLLELIRTLDLAESPGPTLRRPPRDNVRTVQNALSAALADEEFYLDCVELEVDAILRRTPEFPRQPLHRFRDLPLQFHMFYWHPGRVAPPHEHTAWTVTAVFYNALEVTTYDWEVAYRERRLERKNVFTAEQGRVGHIFERCIHHPANITNTVSTSIHIFNECDKQRIDDEVGPIAGLSPTNVSPPQATEEELAAAFQWGRDYQLQVLTRVLSQFRTQRTLSLLAKISANGNEITQARVDRVRWLIGQA